MEDKSPLFHTAVLGEKLAQERPSETKYASLSHPSGFLHSEISASLRHDFPDSCCRFANIYRFQCALQIVITAIEFPARRAWNENIFFGYNKKTQRRSERKRVKLSAWLQSSFLEKNNSELFKAERRERDSFDCTYSIWYATHVHALHTTRVSRFVAYLLAHIGCIDAFPDHPNLCELNVSTNFRLVGIK